MRSCQSSRNSSSGCATTPAPLMNRSSVARTSSNTAMLKLMHSIPAGCPSSSNSTLLTQRMRRPSQLSFSYGPITRSRAEWSVSSSAESSPTSRLDRLFARYSTVWSCRSWITTSAYGKNSVAMPSAIGA